MREGKPTPDRILIYLLENREGATTGRLARTLGVTTNSAMMAARRLEREGWVSSRKVREAMGPRGREWATSHWRVL